MGCFRQFGGGGLLGPCLTSRIQKHKTIVFFHIASNGNKESAGWKLQAPGQIAKGYGRLEGHDTGYMCCCVEWKLIL